VSGKTVDAKLATSRSLTLESWQLAGIRAYHGLLRHRGLDSAAALAFFGALVLVPASLAVVSAFAVFDSKARASGDILKIVRSFAPASTVAEIRDPLTQLFTLPNAGYALALGIVLTVWTLSGYVTAFGRAVNTAYDVQEGRRWIPLRASMILVAIVLLIALAVVVAIVSGTPTVAGAIAKTLGWSPAVAIVWDILKWPVLAGLAAFVVGVLYFYSPNVHHLRIRWVTWGALLAIAVWVLATVGFGIYILNFSHYNKVYGWLGGAVILLLWLYLSNLVVVFGAEMDAEIVRARQLEAGIDAVTEIQLPLRSTRRIQTLDHWAVTDRARSKKLLDRAKARTARTTRAKASRKG
jgi:membrane protein